MGARLYRCGTVRTVGGPSARKIPAMLFYLCLALILAACTVFIGGVLAAWAVKQVLSLWLGKR
jgi:hypothetical protein